MRQINLAGTIVNDDSDCYVIAEVGHNHQGSVAMAEKLFRKAKECGANAVKLQKRCNKALYTQEAYDKPYDNPNSFGDTYGQHREALEFGYAEYKGLKEYAAEIGITMFATAFDFESADFLEKLDMPIYKTASGDLKNIPLLTHIAKIGKPMIISTGGATMDDVMRMFYAVYPINSNICILQCTAGYPAEFNELNLSVISSYRNHFGNTVIGLSSHDNGIAMPVAAYMLGARVVEKHFTLNHTMKGTDHAFSLEPIGFAKMVRDLQRTRLAMGDGVKRVYPSEELPILKMGKKLVAAHDLEAGHKIRMRDIAIKSPGDGMEPYKIGTVVGKTTKKGVKKDEGIEKAI